MGLDPGRRGRVRAGRNDARRRRTDQRLVLRDTLLKSIYAFFLGWPLYYGMRFALRAALVDEPPRRAPAAADASLGVR